MKKTILIALATMACAAHAHVTLEYEVAAAGASYKATFRVGHGCGASPTKQIAVTIPDGVKGAHPMPKPGWTLELRKDADRVARVVWTAKTREDMLPSTQYDEFVLVARMPDQAGSLYWPVSQVCEEGRADWKDVPQAGQSLAELKSPAAYLEVIPADGTASGHHH
ncbi:MAG TPA: YcnI family protein [Ramlibacter sp.]|uniref:YcnI family copper-binding membrane protein n=1 Tax=Ramlibacter sp. TaxID=1917967 RepID=UPI002BE9DFA0|nr:YcnI family protein [Ramlibacter sp.]HVZ43782.1 YcnI family protein [Ramlibacter sp.]